MNILDIVGPVMVGPSSSHTAGGGADRSDGGKAFGRTGRECKDRAARLFFWQQGADMEQTARLWRDCWGWQWMTHGFRKASQKQKKAGLSFSFEGISLMNAHPNSVRLEVTGESGRKLEVIGASIGGGRIRICEIDGLTANFSGEAPTLVVYNQDKPGCIVKSNVAPG